MTVDQIKLNALQLESTDFLMNLSKLEAKSQRDRSVSKN